MRDGLLAELQRFRPHDHAERSHLDSIIALLQCDEFASRHNYHPGHLTASAFIVDPATHRLLLLFHRRLGRWLQMGGHLEPGEIPAAAARREAFEESGLPDLEAFAGTIFDVDVHEIPAGSEPAHQHHDLRYLFRTSRPHDIVVRHDESLSLRWFSFDEAAGVMNEACSRRAIEKIRLLLG